MDVLRPKNWAEFQHYKDRSPAWIKLHRSILDDYDFSRLPIASKALAPLLWLLAAEYKDGEFPADPERIAHRLRWQEFEVMEAIIPLIEKGFFIDASNTLAECYQVACLEERRGYKAEERREETVQPTALPRRANPYSESFEAFWIVYPNKKDKKDAYRAWKKDGCESVLDDLISHVRLMMEQDDGWKRGYVPMGSTYLNGRRWEDIPKGPTRDKLSKTAQAMMTLEGMGNGLDDSGNQDRLPKIDMPRLGSPARFGTFGGNGNGVG